MNILPDFNKDLFQKGLQRSHSFNVEITLPDNVNSDPLRIRAEFTSIQVPVLSTAKYRHGNTFLKAPVDREPEQMTIGFLPDTFLSQHDILTTWMDSIIHGHHLTDINYFDNYLGEIVISLFDINNNKTSEFTVYEAFPINISQIDVNKTIKDDIVRFTCAFIYTEIKQTYSNKVAGNNNTHSTLPKYNIDTNINDVNNNTFSNPVPSNAIDHELIHNIRTGSSDSIDSNITFGTHDDTVINKMKDSNVFNVGRSTTDNDKLTNKALALDVLLKNQLESNNNDYGGNLQSKTKSIIMRIKHIDDDMDRMRLTTSDNLVETDVTISDGVERDGIKLLHDEGLINTFTADITATGLTSYSTDNVDTYVLSDPKFNSLSRRNAFSLDKIRNMFIK